MDIKDEGKPKLRISDPFGESPHKGPAIEKGFPYYGAIIITVMIDDSIQTGKSMA